MNELKIFSNSDFGELGVMVIDGKEYFPAAQCARVLGYSNPQKAVRDHCDDEGCTKRSVLTNSGTQEMKFITEGNLYRLIVRSKLPAAKKFEHWVFDEVLPEIRKTGGYGSVDIESVIAKTVSETVKAIIPYLSSVPAMPAPEKPKRVAVICKAKPVYKIDLLPDEIRKQVDDMLCSGDFTSKEVSKFIESQTGMYISYVTLCNYKRSHFILVDANDAQLSFFSE